MEEQHSLVEKRSRGGDILGGHVGTVRLGGAGAETQAGQRWREVGAGRGSERGERVCEVVPLAGPGPGAGDCPSCVSPSPSVNGDGRLCTHFAGLWWTNRLTPGTVAQSGGSVSGGFIVLSHWGSSPPVGEW